MLQAILGWIFFGYFQFPCSVVVLLFLSMDISQTCRFFDVTLGAGGGEDVKMDLELDLKKVSSWVEKLGTLW